MMKYVPILIITLQDDIPIIIYKNGKDLMDTVKIKGDNLSAPLGVYYSGTINLLSPNVWIERGNLIEEYKSTTPPVVHEFTHLIVDEKKQKVIIHYG